VDKDAAEGGWVGRGVRHGGFLNDLNGRSWPRARRLGLLAVDPQLRVIP
jgi:hypothetical protein